MYPRDTDLHGNHPILIIGSGPAGLTAAIYAARFGLRPLILEGDEPGGQLMGTTYVENWPGERKILGPELMMKMRNHAADLGATLISGRAESVTSTDSIITVTTSRHQKISCHALIVATGAHPRKLGCPGEQTYWGAGVSSCAVCDGALFKDQPIVIVGGGNAALENALFMSNITNKITIIHRGSELSASEQPLRKAVLASPNITIIYDSTVEEIMGSGPTADGGQVTGVKIVHGPTGSSKILETKAVFVSVGQIPTTDFLPKNIERTPSGHLAVHDGTQSSIPGIFGAGDVVDFRYRQAITSAGDGCKAALDAQNYLKKLVLSL